MRQLHEDLISEQANELRVVELGDGQGGKRAQLARTLPVRSILLGISLVGLTWSERVGRLTSPSPEGGGYMIERGARVL